MSTESTATKATARRKAEPEPAAPAPERGPLSPAQHEDDGWGDTPVQMRG